MFSGDTSTGCVRTRPEGASGWAFDDAACTQSYKIICEIEDRKFSFVIHLQEKTNAQLPHPILLMRCLHCVLKALMVVYIDILNEMRIVIMW